MTFEDQQISLEGPFGEIPVTVTADALHMLWGANTGPQDADGLIAANRAMIEQVALMKFEAGEVEENGRVHVTDYDLEG
ncbi:hypothetical protein DMC47_34300 [Nostoc sp. 3335mG]|nr:hypothetical protein DMC47_34300 [Nostoc sp. 3335mG]